MTDETKFVTVTAKPVITTSSPPNTTYHLSIDSINPSFWVEHGRYTTIDEVLRAFTPPIKQSYQDALVAALTNGEEISFSLEHAYDSL